jgi:peptidoglycan/LPS O-acetylase OafA/YrhL
MIDKNKAALAHNNRRQDIQGLRAIAVLMVISFHAGLPIPGGFTGVDVFFVISGFVITTVVNREITDTGSINWARFFARRFKRLAPGLSAMIASSMIISFFLSSPDGALKIASQTGTSATLFSANLFLARSTQQYFGPLAVTNPFLHTWSLSVEEQFFFTIPILVILTGFLRKSNRRLFISLLIGTISVLSIILTILPENTKHSTFSAIFLSFYSPFPRIWEFLIGSIVALTQKYSYLLSKELSRITQIVSVLLLVYSAFFITENTSWPSYQTLFPVLGTALIIFSGSNRPSKFISHQTMVWIGDRSYSIYIWHWPFVVFVGLVLSRSVLILSIATCASIVAAMMSYKFVEQYWRNWSSRSQKASTLFFCCVIGIPLLVTNSTVMITDKVIKPIYTNNSTLIANQGDSGQDSFNSFIQQKFSKCKLNDPLFNSSVVNCGYSNNSDNSEIVILGDSHTEPVFLGLAMAKPGIAFRYLMFNSAPGYQDNGVQDVVDKLSKMKSVKSVIFVARWSIRGVNVVSLGDSIKVLSDSGKFVFLSDDIPGFPFDAFGCKYRRAGFLPAKCSISRKSLQQEQSIIENRLHSLAQGYSNVEILKSFKYFCNLSTCTMARESKLLFRDENHLNIAGSLLLGDLLLEDYPQIVKSK